MKTKSNSWFVCNFLWNFLSYFTECFFESLWIIEEKYSFEIVSLNNNQRVHKNDEMHEKIVKYVSLRLSYLIDVFK
jgi:hypothetical protein